MKNKILDCTLRDGGHVNHADFGKSNIIKIISGLVKSNVDYVELGFLRDGKFTENQALFNDVSQIYPLLPKQYINTEFTVMIRPDWYDIKQLSQTDGRIQLIRFAFYYKDLKLMEEYSKIVKHLGYRYICNPVNIMGYSDDELVTLVGHINEIHPEQFTMVDTYGAMTMADLHRVYGIVENYLSKDIRIGLHLHENRALSFGIAQEFLKIKDAEREAVIDGSLMGMGRMPGNLCIELIADYMNGEFEGDYSLSELYQIIGDVIEPIKKKIPWGYSPAYFITAKLNMHRSYAEYLLGKENLSLYDMNRILNRVAMDKRKEFHEDYVKQLYTDYVGGDK